MSESQLFSESEIAEIVRRAAELQEEGSATGYVPGLTTDELRRMAAEAGIEATYLEKAITERNARKRFPSKKFKWVEEVDKVLPVELNPEDFDIVTEAVNVMPVTTHQGVTSGGMSQIGRSLMGQVHAGWDQPHIKITSAVEERS